MLTESMQDYLKTIYEMVENGGRATTNALAEHRGVTAASVTGMLKKLSELKLVEYERYQGVLLTKAGEQIALSVIRHHRLMELYLTETMGYSWDRVHAEADKLEHVISEEFVDKVSALLGNPQHDPHGSPIPSKEGAVAASSQLALSDVPAGRTVQVQHVTDENPVLLREVALLGLLPRVNLIVVARDSQTISLSILVSSREPEQQQRSVAHELAQHIFVTET